MILYLVPLRSKRLLVLAALLFQLRLERHLGAHLLAALAQQRLTVLELQLQLLQLLHAWKRRS